MKNSTNDYRFTNIDTIYTNTFKYYTRVFYMVI